MGDITQFNSKPVFKNQPILCPWVTCQPYPSSQLIKNKLSDFVKKHGSDLNSNVSKKTLIGDPTNLGASSKPVQQASSTHFFYFLRLMQLFPDTHPATLHTVLTLSKHNFFFAIDKLLYAQKCKNDLNRKLGTFSGRGRNYTSSNRGRPSYSRPTQRYQPMPRPVPTDLAEVQRIIDIADKPYVGVQPVDNNADDHQQVMKICMQNPDEFVHGTQAFVETDNHEVIEIVCFDNEQTVLKQTKDDDDGDDMDIETFDENIENIEPSIADNITIPKMEEDPEPPVIVVDTEQDSGDLNQGHLVEQPQMSQTFSADLANNPIDHEEMQESNKPFKNYGAENQNNTFIGC